MAENIHDVLVQGALEQDALLTEVAERAQEAPVSDLVAEAMATGNGDLLVDGVMRAAVLASLEQFKAQRDMAATQVTEEAAWIEKADPSTIRAVTSVDIAQARAAKAEQAAEE
jgi:hypothetical protein